MNDLDRIMTLLNARHLPRLAGVVGNVRAALQQLIEAVEKNQGVEEAVAAAKDLLKDDPE